MVAEEHVSAGRGPSRVARHAIRTTLSACAAFYACLYGLDRPVAATYALFAVVSMAALSRIPGTGEQRAAVVVRTLPVACLLLTAGTFLAVRTWTAVAGMLVFGFAIAFVAAAGPRAAGAAPGLQLLYILPCFPPYAPGTLGERLGGAIFGLVLLVLAEKFVLPEPRGTTYRELVAGAGDTAARFAAELGRPPYTLPAAEVEAARNAGESLRPLHVEEAERPAGPGLRDRALAHTGLGVRTLLGRLAGLPPPPPGLAPAKTGLELLEAVGRSAAETSALLAGTGRATDGAAALRRLREEVREAAEREPQPVTEVRGRRRAALLEVADAAVAFATAAELAVRGRRAPMPTGTDSGRFWYAGRRAPGLWWHRLAAHAGPRSVHFQNAVRISLALAAARAVAGVESLPHGFWAMLAVLSLTRTTVTQTRATVRQALAGTLLGALLAAGVLVLVGGHTTVYAVILPLVMLVAFLVGPVRGVGWAQGMFTLVVSFVFAQLAPVTWRLAEIRLMDVVVGSMIGIVFGLLAWPRGAQAELHRAVALLLAREAETVEATAAAVAAGRRDTAPDDRALRLALSLAECAYAQRQSEPRAPVAGAPDWQAAMITGHHVLWGSRRLLARAGPDLGPGNGERLGERADGVAARMRGAARWAAAVPPEAAARAGAGRAAVTEGGEGAGGAGGAGGPEEADGTGGAGGTSGTGGAGGTSGTGGAGSAARRPEGVAPAEFFAAQTWLDSLTLDVERVLAPCRAVDPAEPAGRDPSASPGPSRAT
ncbi:FUSC family protein [Streptomyces sp. PCS3-D2]|uniref:FUSC family protein n=1 Tax=Streptomyces sp. PCS3-D2 TaxID=1460244 RepID=UPI00272D4431|nr:FUSC family protein [Streptomyces sp. PCS3-D2]WKV71216.1 FUSC family protein [Streptomyces sp. PCS3-D2]